MNLDTIFGTKTGRALVVMTICAWVLLFVYALPDTYTVEAGDSFDVSLGTDGVVTFSEPVIVVASHFSGHFVLTADEDQLDSRELSPNYYVLISPEVRVGTWQITESTVSGKLDLSLRAQSDMSYTVDMHPAGKWFVNILAAVGVVVLAVIVGSAFVGGDYRR